MRKGQAVWKLCLAETVTDDASNTLAYSKVLVTAAVLHEHTGANADRDFIMPELATKADIAELKHRVDRQGLNIVVQLGGLIVVATGVLATLIMLI